MYRGVFIGGPRAGDTQDLDRVSEVIAIAELVVPPPTAMVCVEHGSSACTPFNHASEVTYRQHFYRLVSSAQYPHVILLWYKAEDRSPGLARARISQL